MSVYEQLSERGLVAPTLVAVVAWAACSIGCSARTLVVVDPCPNGGVATCSSRIDSSVFDVSDAADASFNSDASLSTLRQGLVGLWHFDELPGSPLAMDSSGNGNHGTLVGLDSTTAWVTGRFGGALQTGGVGYALVPLKPSIAGIVVGVTVSAWIYWEGTIPVDFGTALSRQIGSTIQQYYHLSLYLDGSPNLFLGTTAVPSAKLTAPPPGIPRFVWTHLAGTYDGSTAALYVDGVRVITSMVTGTFPVDTTPVILGGNGNNQVISERFPGRIDEIALYDRALDANEIQQLASGVTF